MSTIHVFVDYKSVESYLAFGDILRLRDDVGCALVWHPFLAKLTEFGYCDVHDNVVTVHLREHYRKKNPYLYRVAKDTASKRSPVLPLRGPTCLLNTTPLLCGLIFVISVSDETHQPSVVVSYHQQAFAAIWDPANQRDVQSPEVVASLVSAALRDATFADVFITFFRGEGLQALRSCLDSAEAEFGVFEAPSFVLEGVNTKNTALFPARGELFSARPSLSLLRHRLGPGTQSIPMRPTGKEQRGPKSIDVYVDLKSPYAYLSIQPTLQLRRDFDVTLNWLPFTLDIQSFLGSAEVGARDNIVKAGTNRRSERQWRQVKYAYADVRRRGALRDPPLQVYGTRKVWDSSLAGLAMLWAKDRGEDALDRYQSEVWPLFWRRELDIEDTSLMVAVLARVGVETQGFASWASGEGRRRLDAINNHARKLGVFGVPTFVVHDDAFLWGGEHLEEIRVRLSEQGYARPIHSSL
uniref:DSBA-like thioredoxin domain-containing protein n=1 Tax=Noctiluca scintillans TaxID=2966 RepID=A0A7S1B0I7_NOCSC|mmetsp:Transcript_8180/g.22616  ORF Transcript_8180/g.22616 Transcript_8180/m.22616 type:complete len:467 (+) Transcript_8180:25-1425(+)